MSESAEEIDLLIENYLDGQMTPEKRAAFQERMAKDPALRERFNSATRSVELVQQALGWVSPGEDFDEKVNTKIVSITHSGQNLRAYSGSNPRNESDARVLDPDALRERRRLILLAVVAALLFALAALAIGHSISQGIRKTPTAEIHWY